MLSVEERGRPLLTRGECLQRGVNHAVIYETGNPRWVMRESKLSLGRDSLYDGEMAAWERVHEGRANPEKFQLTEQEEYALKHHVLVPVATQTVSYNNRQYLRSFYPRMATDVERFLFSTYTKEKVTPRFNQPQQALDILGKMVDQISPAVDSLIKLRIYHGDILMINTLLDEQSVNLSIIDFGRSAVYTGVKTSGEEEYYKYMKGGFVFTLDQIIEHYSLNKISPHLGLRVDAFRRSIWSNSYEGNSLSCEDISRTLRPLISQVKESFI